MSSTTSPVHWRAVFGLMMVLWMPSAWAGLSVLTDGTTTPVVSANQRTVDFSTITLSAGTNVSADGGRLSVTTNAGSSSGFGRSAGSISFTGSSSLAGFSGHDMDISSGSTDNASSVTINFTNPTPYVGFMWATSLTRENNMVVDLTLQDNSVVTLKNCSDGTSNLCVGYYVPSNWLSSVLNLLLGWLLGSPPQYQSVYVQYQPSNGVKIKSMKMTVSNCSGCGFLSADSTMDFEIDNLTYVDAAVAPDHINITTSFGSIATQSTQTYTVTACGDATCSTPYISGITGTLAIAGVGSPSLSNAGVFTIAPGPNNNTTVTGSVPTPGTATLSLSAYAPTPTNATKKYFCGVNGATPTATSSCNFTVAQSLHHVEVTTDNQAKITCKPTTYAIKACADAACSVPYTQGLSGTLAVSGQTVNYPSGASFNIANGSSSTTLATNITTVGSATVALSSLSTSASGSPSVYCGMNGVGASNGGSCAVNTVDSALFFTVADHVSDAAQTVTISAVQKNVTTNACTAALVNVSKPITLACAYVNPTSGSKSTTVTDTTTGSSAALSCGASGALGSTATATLAFNGSGVATTTLRYPDVGKVGLSASYASSTGADAGLSMNSGTVNFTAVPASFSVAVAGAPIKAGSAFSATVTALNSNNVVTPNFNKESTPEKATLTWARLEPAVTTTSVNDVFTGSSTSVTGFAAGVATVNGLKWLEVGKGNVTATLSNANYLGTTGVGQATGFQAVTFIPHHFQVDVTQGCTSATAFTYSGQPFGVKVTALNAASGTTYYYDGSGYTTPNYAKVVTLSPQVITPGGTAYTYANNVLTIGSFTQGVADATSTAATLTGKLTPSTQTPVTLSLRATDTDGVSSATYDGSVTLRSGRIKVANAFGSEKTSLDIGVQAQYWNGKAWVLNADDSCTRIPVASVALSNYIDSKGNAAAWTTTPATKTTVNATPMAVSFSGGNGTMTLSSPTSSGTGSVNFAFNLGATSLDQSCLVSHPNTTAANLNWLRAQNGTTNSCAGVTTYDRDPSARATFGVFAPETRKAVFTRELY